jgi:protein pelota
MQIIKKNFRAGEIVVKVDSKEDLWHLSQLIMPGDSVSGKTERKIKLGGSAEKTTVVKKTIFVKINVEKVEFHKTSDELRINGTVTEGPEDVPNGSHQTVEVEPGSTLGIVKEKWMGFELEKLDEATTHVASSTLVLIFDREEAIFATLKNRGHEILSQIKGDVSKKAFDEGKKASFYQELSKMLIEYDKRLMPKNIVVASPSFWKEYLMKEVSDELRKKIVLATCSDVSVGALSEVMQRPELGKVLEGDRAAKELVLIDEIMRAIAKEEACYGLKESEEKIKLGAVKELMVSYSHLSKLRESNENAKLEYLMKVADERGAKVHLISTEEASKKLDGLGGVAGVLRWKV